MRLRLLFNHRDASDAEHRLVMRVGGRGPEYGGGAGDARESAFQEYVRKMREDNESMIRGLSRSAQISQRRYVEEKIRDATARYQRGETFHDIRNVQDAHQRSHLLLASAGGAVIEGNSVDRTPARIKAEQDRRISVEMKKRESWDAQDAQVHREQIAQGIPLWETSMFKALDFASQRASLVSQMEWKLGSVPATVLVQYGLRNTDGRVMDVNSAGKSVEYIPQTARDSAAVFTSTESTAPVEFRRRSPSDRVPVRRPIAVDSGEFVGRYEERSAKFQDYVIEQDRLIDAELSSALQRANILRDGPQKAALMRIVAKYRTERAQWGERVITEGERIEALFGSKGKDIDGKTNPGSLLDIPEELRKAVKRVPGHAQAEFARQIVYAGMANVDLPKTLQGIRSEVKAVIEQSKQLTGEKMAEFIVLRRKWDAVEGADLPPQTLRTVGEELLKSIDALGLHLFVNHVWENAAEDEHAAFMADVQRRIAEKGLPAVEDEELGSLTPDRQGMRNLLVVKNGVLQTLCAIQHDDILLRRRLVAALARTQRAFVEHGGSKDEIEEVNAQRVNAQRALAQLSNNLTTLATLAPNQGEGLAAAQRERFVLEELLSNPDVDQEVRKDLEQRLGELKRTPEALGIIAQECDKVLDPLRAATDTLAIDSLATSIDCSAALATIRAEGSMLWKLRSELHPDVVQKRLGELVTMQCNVIKKQWDIERMAAGDDVRKIGEAIVRSTRSLGNLRSSSLNNEAVNEIHEKLSKVARAMREPVNAAILAAKADESMSIKRVQSAVEMIVAEGRALQALGIDADRIESIREEFSLLDALVEDVEEKVVIGKQSIPDLAKFKEMSALLHQEDKMVRAVFHESNERMNARILSIEAQRASLMESFNKAVDVAVKNLDEKKSTPEQVQKASELLEEAFRQKGGDGMENVQELERFKEMREKVATVRKAVEKRERSSSSFDIVPDRVVDDAEKGGMPRSVYELFRSLRDAFGVRFVSHDKEKQELTVTMPTDAWDRAFFREFAREGYVKGSVPPQVDKVTLSYALGEPPYTSTARTFDEPPEGVSKEDFFDVAPKYRNENDENFNSGNEFKEGLFEFVRRNFDPRELKPDVDRERRIKGALGLLNASVIRHWEHRAQTNSDDGGDEPRYLLHEGLTHGLHYDAESKTFKYRMSPERKGILEWMAIEAEIRGIKGSVLLQAEADTFVSKLNRTYGEISKMVTEIDRFTQIIDRSPFAGQGLAVTIDGQAKSIRWNPEKKTCEIVDATSVPAPAPVPTPAPANAKEIGTGEGTRSRGLSGVPEPVVEAPTVEIPQTIGEYSVTVKSPDDIMLSRDGYELHIRATKEPVGYYLWDGSDDGYHISTIEGTSPAVPNQDPLGFFKTLPEAFVALKTTVDTKNVVDKMKEWKERNKQATDALVAYFDADNSLTKARGWTRKDGLNFYEKGTDHAIASIVFLRRDDNFLRFSRPSDVRYGRDTKEYPSVQAMIDDMPEFLRKKELPALSTVLDRVLVEDDMRVLDERMDEVASLSERQILALIDAVRAFDGTRRDNWANAYVSKILPLVAPKSVRLLREYSSRLRDYMNTGVLGYNEGFDPNRVDVSKLAEQFVQANPNDPVTLREAGLSLQMVLESAKARPLLERALENGDILAGIILMKINEGNIFAMRPYVRKVLDLARKENKDQPFITELEQQLAAMDREQPEAPNEKSVTPAAASAEPMPSEPIPSLQPSKPSEESERPLAAKLADIDVLLRDRTEESMKRAVDKFFFLVKDAEVAARVALEKRRGGETRVTDTTTLSALANEFYGSSGRKSFTQRLRALPFHPSGIDARLREIHLALLPYASGSLIPSRSASESGTSESVMPQISFDDLDTPSSR